MLAQASAFIAGPIPARASAFVAASVARASAFIAGDPAQPPTDYTVAFADDCATVTVTVARDWTDKVDVVARIETQAGSTVSAVTLDLESTFAVIRFTPPRDGMYSLLVSDVAGRLYRAPVPVYCRALHCLRELNRPVATEGRNGQAQVPSAKWRNVTARLRASIACANTRDYVTADALFDSISTYCDDCGCDTCTTC